MAQKQKHNFYGTGKDILSSGISMGETNKRPLQDVDLYHIDADGRVHLTNVRGGLSGQPCYSVAMAQAWVDDLYPDAEPLEALEELNEIANKRCEEYLNAVKNTFQAKK